MTAYVIYRYILESFVSVYAAESVAAESVAAV